MACLSDNHPEQRSVIVASSLKRDGSLTQARQGSSSENGLEMGCFRLKASLERETFLQDKHQLERKLACLRENPLTQGMKMSLRRRICLLLK